METSATFVGRLLAPPYASLCPYFSDRSHLEFYQRRSSSLPSLSLRHPLLRSPSSLGPFRAACQSGCNLPLMEPTSQQSSLMKELAELKQQIKQKKKELKSQRGDEKKKLKMQRKEEEKRAMKQKDCMEGRKRDCDSESSSSSESSDEECDSQSMRSLREERALACTSSKASVCSEGKAAATDGHEESCGRTFPVPMPGANSFVHASAASHVSIDANGVCCNDKAESTAGKAAVVVVERAVLTERNSMRFQNSQASNRIEVCAGGKCKKAGSEQLLSALRMQIPSASNVVAVPCKCMGNCSLTMNVKVLKEDTNPQHHSHVRVEDANFILSHHYGLGRPPSGLPSLEPHDRSRIPATRSV